MTLDAERMDTPVSDAVANVLKWALFAVAILTFALLAWATTATYRLVPPQPDRFLGADGAVLMTIDNIIAGKGGFQRADLMDYCSLYGMGSYYGEGYTASTLVRLGAAARDNIARAANGNPFASLTPDQQAAATAAMQRDLHRGWNPDDRSRFALIALQSRLRDVIAPALGPLPRPGWAHPVAPIVEKRVAEFSHGLQELRTA